MSSIPPESCPKCAASSSSSFHVKQPTPSMFARSFPPQRRRGDAAAVAIVAGATAASEAIQDPIARLVVVAVGTLVSYILGIFQPSPRGR